MQYELFTNGVVKKTIEYLPINLLDLSEFNYRKTRRKNDIEKLAERIIRNGFEVTRALWAYPKNGRYEVFAGGNRLEAAKLAKLESVPVVVHTGLIDSQIAKLAVDDNENDEYHTPVDMVDVWHYYDSLYRKLGTEQAVADLLDVSRKNVNFKINLARLPDWLKEFGTKQSLEESKMREFLRLVQCTNVYDWATDDDILHYVADRAAKKSNLTAY
jgi:ParB family chromosome partitioning protein